MKPSPIARIIGAARKAESPLEFVKKVKSETLVKIYANPKLRRLIRPFFRTKTPQKWVFLIGCYNSGTTLLQHILSAHPDLAGMPKEGVRFTSHLKNLEHNGHHMMWADDWRDHAAPSPSESAAAVQEIVKDWSIFWDDHAIAFMDKSIANSGRLKWLNENFENAHFIILFRDGKCISEGLKRRARPPEWLREKTGLNHYPIASTAGQWATCNKAILDDLPSLDRKILLRFEDLVDHPEEETERLLQFLDLPTHQVSSQENKLIIADQTFEIRNPNPSSLKRLSEDEIIEIQPIVDPVEMAITEALQTNAQ